MAKKNFYAIAKGRKSGVIVETWAECEVLVKGYKGAKFKGFTIRGHAEIYLDEHVIYTEDILIDITTIVVPPHQTFVHIPAMVDKHGRPQTVYYMKDGIRMADHGRTIGRGYVEYHKSLKEKKVGK